MGRNLCKEKKKNFLLHPKNGWVGSVCLSVKIDFLGFCLFVDLFAPLVLRFKAFLRGSCLCLLEVS